VKIHEQLLSGWASQETTSLAAGSLELQTPHPLDLRKMIPSEKNPNGSINGPTYHNWMSYDEFQQFQPLKCYVQSIHINSKDVRITLCCFGVQDLDIGFFRNLPPTASPQSEASHAGRWLGACHGMRSELMSVQMGSIIGYDMWIWYEHIWTIVVYGYELKFVFHLLIILDPLLSIQSHSSKHLPSSSFPSIFAECIHQPPWRTKGLNLAVGIYRDGHGINIWMKQQNSIGLSDIIFSFAGKRLLFQPSSLQDRTG